MSGTGAKLKFKSSSGFYFEDFAIMPGEDFNSLLEQERERERVDNSMQQAQTQIRLGSNNTARAVNNWGGLYTLMFGKR